MNKIVPSNQAIVLICSLNCDGFNRNTDYIRDVLATRKPDMFCLQETWLLDSQRDDLNSVHQGYLSLSKSGVDSTIVIYYREGQKGACVLCSERTYVDTLNR